MRLHRKDGLNVVPFIDIMLVLLAIVLSISTFIAQGKIKLDLPEASSKSVQKNEKKVVIAVDKDNAIYIDDQKISEEELASKIAQISKDAIIELKSDKQSKFEYFVKIVDTLKANEHENFYIQTLVR